MKLKRFWRTNEMKLEGKIWKEKQYWLVEVPMLDIFTQGHNQEDALDMIEDAIESLVNKKGFKVRARMAEEKSSPDENITILLSTKTPNPLLALILKRQRAKSQLSLNEVAKILGQASKTAFARYEKGEVEMSLTKFEELYNAITKKTILLRESA